MTSSIISSTVNSDPRSVTVKRHARAKRLRLRVDPRSGAVLLTIPARVSERRARAWAAEQQGWIDAALADLAPALPLRPGSIVPLYGQPHVAVWQQGASRAVRVEPGRLVTGGPEETFAPRLLRWLRGQAAVLMERETRDFAARAGVTIARVGVGDPVSRWGSCSAAGAIRYSWRLILAPECVRRATVAHEVAHRVHLNHGPDFHVLVAQLLDADPRPARLWLRHHGATLHRFGRP